MRLNTGIISSILFFIYLGALALFYILFKGNSPRISESIAFMLIISVLFVGFGIFVILRFLQYIRRDMVPYLAIFFSILYFFVGIAVVYLTDDWYNYLIFLLFSTYILWRFR